MKSFKLILFLLSVNSLDLFKTTHAVQVSEKNDLTDNKDTKTIIDLSNSITVKTGLNLDKPLTQINVTKASDIPKSRKVTPVDNGSAERKSQNEGMAIESKSANTPTAAAPTTVTKILTESGVALNVNGGFKNFTEDIKPNSAGAKSNESFKNNATSEVKMQEKNNSNTTTPTIIKTPPATSAATTKPYILANNTLDAANTTAGANSKPVSKISSPTAGTTTSSSTTTTTTTTTPKPKKPTITYGVPDFPDLEKDNPELKHLLQASDYNKLPIPDVPYAQPSQEFNGSFHRGRDFILPIVSTIFIIPLVIGIIITSYRRFRDCWSTRHYRRMDFLVDGMYND